jgi:hypothetical protein
VQGVVYLWNYFTGYFGRFILIGGSGEAEADEIDQNTNQPHFYNTLSTAALPFAEWTAPDPPGGPEAQTG